MQAKGGVVDVQKWDGGVWSTKCRVDLVTERVKYSYVIVPF